MILLISTFAAITATLIWYVSEKARELKIGILCNLFWGASLMWFVDAAAEYYSLREEYFTPAIEDMVNDGFFGCSVVVFALLIWIVYLLIKDPKHVVRNVIRRNA